MDKMIMIDRLVEHLDRRAIPFTRKGDDIVCGNGWMVRATFSRTVKGSKVYVMSVDRHKRARSQWTWIADPYNVADAIEQIHYGC